VRYHPGKGFLFAELLSRPKLQLYPKTGHFSLETGTPLSRSTLKHSQILRNLIDLVFQRQLRATRMTTAESHLVEWVFKGLSRFPGEVKGLGTVSIVKPP